MHVVLWICSSILIGISLVVGPATDHVLISRYLGFYSAYLALLGGIIRYAALAIRAKGFIRDRKANGLILLSLALAQLALFEILLDYRGLIVTIVAITISLASFLALMQNRYWTTVNRTGLNALLLGLALAAILLLCRVITVYPFAADHNFAGSSSLQVFSTAAVVAVSFVLQMGFTGMLFARQARVRIFSDRRNLRAWGRAANIAAQSKKFMELSEQRLDFIQLLTHEIRQPINNAQASLQSVSSAMELLPTSFKGAEHALQRATSALDGITLALSNVILLGTLNAGDQKWHLQPTDVFEILAMARLDCSPTKHKRIILTQPGNSIFVECVPIFLRVALHNLFEHALSLAKIDSDIRASIDLDDVKLGVTFSIFLEIDQREVPALTPYTELSFNDTLPSSTTSLGVFAAERVADYHYGDILIEQKNNDNLVFKLFISL
jgi:signal transduction histidine kinase